MDESVYLLPRMPNTYMDLLVDCYPDSVSVYTNESRHPFSLFCHDVVSKRPNTLHLHWPHPYFLFYGAVPVPFIETIASILAAVFFLIQVYISSFFVESVVWTVHNRENHDALKPYTEKFVHLTLARMADTVTAWDTQSKEILAADFAIPRDKVQIVPHNNYQPIYRNEVGKLPGHINGITSSYERIFLYFGRIRPYKGVLELIDVFEETANGDQLLVIAGNPEEELRSAVERRIQETPHVVGDLRYIPDDVVPAYFELADIAVFPYRKIFNSGSIVLAMSFGVPFVAPDMGAVRGVAPNGNIIYHSLESGLLKAATMDEWMLEKVGHRNLRVAQQDHSQAAVRKALMRAYGWS